MKNLLISLSVLVVLLINGCATSSSSEPQVYTSSTSDTKIRKNTAQCITAKDVEKMNRGRIKQIVKIEGQKNTKLFLALDPKLSYPEIEDKRYQDKHFVESVKRIRKVLFSTNIDHVIIWELPWPGGIMGSAVPFKNECVFSDYGEPDHLEKLKLMHETSILISKYGLSSLSVRDNLKKLLMVSGYKMTFKDEMIDKFINNIRSLIKK